MRRIGTIAAVGALAASLAGFAPTGAIAGATSARSVPATSTMTVAPSSVTIGLSTVASGFTKPTYVTSARDGLGRLFVVQQGGLVKIVLRGRVISTPYLNLTSKVATGGNEQGLLSIVFHPSFQTRPYLYAAYTRKSDGALVVSRFSVRSYRDSVVSASTERVLLVAPHPSQTNHNGGQLHFGPDNYFYIGTGDGGGGGDPYRNAEKFTSLLGKLLRINVDATCGRKPYCIPSSNPFAKSTSTTIRKEIFDYGLRNPWRFSFDRSDKTLWIGDVGQDRYEEIDHATTVGGRDFGWSCKEAFTTYNSNACTINGHARNWVHPTAAYSHGANDSTGCAVIGGYVYRGPTYAWADGLYVFTDFCSATIWATGRTSAGYSTVVTGHGSGNPTGFGESDGGDLYLVNQNGHLYRVTFTKH
jgi:glucose/arabinose dehydrogenase